MKRLRRGDNTPEREAKQEEDKVEAVPPRPVSPRNARGSYARVWRAEAPLMSDERQPSPTTSPRRGKLPL
jgi:hypothetical protein